MSGRTRRVRHPTPGARATNESAASGSSASQFLAENRSDSEELDEEGEWPNSTNAQVIDGVVFPLAADLAKRSTAKRTKDTKWSTTMEEKLAAVVYSLKAHLNTDIAKYKKWDLVKAKLVADRDFLTVEGLADKSSQAFEVKFRALMKHFMTSHSIENEGANLSGLDGDTLSSFNRLDNTLYAMALEVWEQDDSKKEKSDKEKRRNASMLSYERTGLAATYLARSGEVSESPIEDLSTSSRGVGDSGFLNRYAVDATAMTIAETNLQLEKEKNEGLRLQLQIEQAKERREQETQRQARDDRRELEMRDLIEQNRRLMAMFSPKKRSRDDMGEESDA